MRKNHWIAGIALIVTLTSLVGCMLSETEHSLYLAPDGAVDWVIRQTDVRASGGDPDKREREERKYLDQARRAAHPPAEGLASLGGRRVRTEILRDERPYAIETTARFRAVDRMFERFFEAIEVRSDARFERVAEGRRLTLKLHDIEPDGTVELEDDEALEDPALGLLDGDNLRLVLTRGQVVDVVGFVATERSDTVLLDWEALEDLVEDDGTLTLSLTWTLD